MKRNQFFFLLLAAFLLSFTLAQPRAVAQIANSPLLPQAIPAVRHILGVLGGDSQAYAISNSSPAAGLQPPLILLITTPF